MKAKELLEKHPKVIILLKDWWMRKVKEALNVSDLSDDYKMIVTDKPVSDVQVERVIDGNPHTLFEFVDENKIFIRTDFTEDGDLFGCSINKNVTYYKFRTRKEAERDAIDDAFELLEKEL